MLTNYVVIDVATAPLPDAAEFLGSPADITPPSNYVKPEAIAKYQAETYAERLEKAGLDIDLAQLTGLALWQSGDALPIILTGNTSSEVAMLETAAAAITTGSALRPIVTYNGHFMDLPLLMRRALYTGVTFPTLSVDRFKGANLDVMLELSYRDPTRRRSLAFYARRLRLGLTKPLSGEAESNVPLTGDWAGLRASLEHDVTVTRAVAQWGGWIK